jgi:hypothetical protein
MVILTASFAVDTNLGNNEKEEFQETLKDISDPIIPIRAKGINNLMNLINRKSQVISDNLKETVTILIQQICHEDSYIYLFASRAIASMILNYSKESISTFIKLYTLGIDESINITESLKLDERLRIGESLTMAFKQNPILCIRYSRLILSHMLFVMRPKDHEKELRSSALSILSIIIEENPDLIMNSHAYELMDYISNLFIFEKGSLETTRGALMILISLIQGYHSSLLQKVPGDILKNIYRQLKNLAAQYDDALLKDNAVYALDLLNGIIKSSIFPLNR